MKFRYLALLTPTALSACGGFSGSDLAAMINAAKGDNASGCFFHQDSVTGTTILDRSNTPGSAVNGIDCNIQHGMFNPATAATAAIPAAPPAPVTSTPAQ